MSDFAHIRRGFDLTDADIDAALESRDTTRALLEHLAEISAPNAGCPKLLLVFAHLASAQSDWIDGDLRVELVAGGDVTVFEVMTDLGGGMRERLMPPIVMKVPIDEFRRSAERLPQLIEPLVAKREQWGRLVLTTAVDATERRSSMPPAAVAISEESLCDAVSPEARSGHAPRTTGVPEGRSPMAVARRAMPESVPPAATTPAPLRGIADMPLRGMPEMPLRGLEGMMPLRGLEGLDVLPDPPPGPSPLRGLDLARSEPPRVNEAHFAGVDLAPEDIGGGSERRSSAPVLEIVDSSAPMIGISDASMLGGTVEGFGEESVDMVLDLASMRPPPGPPRGIVELPATEETPHAPTARGLPVASAVRLPTEPPASFRGYRAPPASTPVTVSEPPDAQGRRQTKEGIPAVTTPSRAPWMKRVKTTPGIPAPGSLGPASLRESQLGDEPPASVAAPAAPSDELVQLVAATTRREDVEPMPALGEDDITREVEIPRATLDAVRDDGPFDDGLGLPLVQPARVPGRWPGEPATVRRPSPIPRHESERPAPVAAPAPAASSSKRWGVEAPTRPHAVTWNVDDDDVQALSLPVIDGRGRDPVPRTPTPAVSRVDGPSAPTDDDEPPMLPVIGARLPKSASPEPRALPEDDDAPPMLPVVGVRAKKPSSDVRGLPEDDDAPPMLPVVGVRAPKPSSDARVVPDVGPRRPAFGAAGATGAAVRQREDLFDDQEPELEVDWGEQGPPVTKRR